MQKIIQKNISELIKAEYNPRKLSAKQREDLRSSLQRFGVVTPVLVNMNNDRKNIIIGGHQRVSVWEELGNKTIDCIEIDLTLEKEKELNVRLNKNTGEFDFDLLEEFFDVDDLVGFGFDDYSFDKGEDVDLDEFFEEQKKQTDSIEKEKKTIILEFSDDEYEKVLQAFDNHEGTKENIVFKLLGL